MLNPTAPHGIKSTPFHQKSKKQFIQLAENQCIHIEMVGSKLQPPCLKVREQMAFLSRVIGNEGSLGLLVHF